MNSLEWINKSIEFLEDMIFMDLALLEDEEDLKDIAEKQKELNILQQIKAELEEYQKLKDKETPKKVIIINHSKLGHSYATHCPNCNEHVIWEDKRCLECGQKLDWSTNE